MSPLKLFFTVLFATIAVGLGAICVVEFAGWFTPEIFPSRPAAVSARSTPVTQPRTNHTSGHLAPGQVWTIHNSSYRKVHVQSQFPVHVVIGSCFNTSTFDYRCDTNPTDIFVQDNRPRPIFSTPQSNAVEVDVTEF
jgi:hypothetical protein